MAVRQDLVECGRSGEAVPETLESLQAWMQALVADGSGGAGQGMEGVEVGTVIRPSSHLPSGERLAIYQRSYRARLFECFQAEYPGLAYTLGEVLFGAFVRDYLERHPPRNYSLHRLAEGFPRYLAETSPGVDGHRAEGYEWQDFLVDLATLERAFYEVYDGPGTEGWGPASSEPMRSWSWHRLRQERLLPAPCLRLFTFRFPVAAYLMAVRRQKTPRIPARATSWVALERQNYRVRLHGLSRTEWKFLCALERGLTVGEALAAVEEVLESAAGVAPLEARLWLGRWLGRNCLRFAA